MPLGWDQTIMWTGLAMVGLHGTAPALDPVMRSGLTGVLVPGLAPWRPYPSPRNRHRMDHADPRDLLHVPAASANAAAPDALRRASPASQSAFTTPSTSAPISLEHAA